MLKKISFTPFIVVAIPALLTACGGGGSTTTTTTVTTVTPVATNFPLNTLYTNLFTTAHSFSLTGSMSTAPGVLVTRDRTITPGGNSVFEGVAVNTATVTDHMTVQGGSPQPTFRFTYSFKVGSYKDIGLSGDGGYGVYANQVALPTTAKIGDFGNFSTVTTYTDSTKKTVGSTGVLTWTLEAGPTANTAYFCTSNMATLADKSNAAEKICYQTDSNGTFGGKITDDTKFISGGTTTTLNLAN